ncbi:MAG: hypothetical protein EBX50_12700 [Chitinophagia bacterium]|nr:hypothetical protein [Chitinophagia bacterium]
MAAINKNRYRLITLLYVIFVCLSVLNIPATLLDSNYYSIRTLEYEEKSRQEQVNFANQLISDEIEKLANDSAKTYLAIQDRIHKTYEMMDKFDQEIQKKLANQKTDVYKEFSSTRKMEEIFLEKEGADKKENIVKVYDELFELVKFLNAQPLQIDSAIRTLIPVKDIIVTRTKKEVEWKRYLFLHKPVAVSYFHIKRIKLLLLDVENVYQLAALKTIGYVLAFYSTQNNTTVLFKQGEMTKVLDAQKQEEIMKRLNEVVNKNTAKAPADETTNDELTKRLKNALQNENFYVGIQNQILKSLNYSATADFSIEVSPDASSLLRKSGNDYYLSFKKQGLYTIKFIDKRAGANKPLFDKKVEVSVLPNPLIKLNTENMTNNIINVKDLLSANRLIAYMGSAIFKNFPGRINGYQVIIASSDGSKQTNYNYGDVFQPKTQSMIGSLRKGDIIIFDNIQISMFDGTTRVTNPMTFKIVD